MKKIYKNNNKLIGKDKNNGKRFIKIMEKIYKI